MWLVCFMDDYIVGITGLVFSSLLRPKCQVVELNYYLLHNTKTKKPSLVTANDCSGYLV